jgi:hypothetical protein
MLVGHKAFSPKPIGFFNPLADIKLIKRWEGLNVKWQEVRNIYPNQFVKFEILHSEEMDNQETIDEVAVIGPIKDENATRELLNSKDNTLVYHTSKDQIVVKIRRSISLRRTL